MFSFFKPIELGINSSCFNIKRYKKTNANICWSFYKKRKKLIIKIYPHGFLIDEEEQKVHVIKHLMEASMLLCKIIMRKLQKEMN